MTTEERVILTLTSSPLPNFGPEVKMTDDLRALLDTWIAWFGECKQEGGDFEDWVEMAARLHGAVSAFGAENVIVQTKTQSGHSALERLACGLEPIPLAPDETFRINHLREQVSLEEVAPLRDIGIVLGRHSPERDLDGDLAARYHQIAAFEAYAGRRFSLADIGVGRGRDHKEIIDQFRAQGIDRLYVKGTEPKTLNAVIEPGQSLADALGGGEDVWYLIANEGKKNALLIQEHIPMRFEYRVFVVNHEAVTGAGTLIERIPLDNTSRFDPYVREHRNDDAPEFGGAPVRDVEMCHILVNFASRVIEELAEDEPAMKDYVIDVALGPNDLPIVIELNPISNSGFYACDSGEVYRAMRDSVR